MEVENPLVVPNQDLGIYQNPLPHHSTNNVSWNTNEKKVTHKWDSNGARFVFVKSVATISQKDQEK